MDFNGLGSAQVFARSRIGEFRSAVIDAAIANIKIALGGSLRVGGNG